jgi:CDP-6-deoxy-D-xylo-4-hexulose-3-dehydrase
MGQEVSDFEQQFADWVGGRYSVMVNSGSSANLAMISALTFRKQDPIRHGDEVIVPAVSWSTTYSPLQQHGLQVKFVDIDPETLNMDLTKLETAITERTKIIFAVNLLGNPNNFDEIKRIIRHRNIILLEDNCESLGAVFNGRQAGTHGLMGSYSLFFSHHISTMEGGVVVTDDEELYHILLCLRAHGWTRDLPKRNLVCSEKRDDPFEESFRFVLPGYNLRPLEMSGAIGKEQLKKLDEIISIRRKNAAYFLELFGRHDWLGHQREIGISSWFGFSLVLKDGAPITRRELTNKLSANGIDVRPIVAGNFVKNEALKWFKYDVADDLINSDRIDRNGLFVGNHHYSLRDEIAFLRSLV